MTLRCGPAPAKHEMCQVSEQEIRQLSKNYRATVLRDISAPEQSGRLEVSWIQLALSKDL